VSRGMIRPSFLVPHDHYYSHFSAFTRYNRNIYRLNSGVWPLNRIRAIVYWVLFLRRLHLTFSV